MAGDLDFNSSRQGLTAMFHASHLAVTQFRVLRENAFYAGQEPSPSLEKLEEHTPLHARDLILNETWNAKSMTGCAR